MSKIKKFFQYDNIGNSVCIACFYVYVNLCRVSDSE